VPSLQGTGFLISVPDSRLPNGEAFGYLVTNRHVAEAIEQDEKGRCVRHEIQRTYVTLNLKEPVNGERAVKQTMPLSPEYHWYFPSAEAVDLAVMPFVLANENLYDIKQLSTDQLLPADVTGQIAIKGPSVMQGYLGDQAGTCSVMADGWFKTGDEGYVSAGNQLFLTGRIKDIINIAGIKVSPFEVEAVLNQHPAVAQSAVVAASDPLYGEVVKAFVQLRPGHALTERDLIRFAGPQLINFQVPKTVTFVDSFPLTNMGKLDRKLLRHRSEIHHSGVANKES